MIKLALAATLALTAAAASAACPGDLTQMRVSKLKPGGSMSGFTEAAKANAAWYASHGLKAEKFVTAPVYENSGGEAKPSVTKIATLHVYGSTVIPKHDAAWDAFVAKYNANASIDSTTLVCLPKGTITIK